MSKHVTANVIKVSTDRMNIALLALNWTIDDKRKEYYSDLCEDDLPGNIEILFNDLITMHAMIIEEVVELQDFRLKLLNFQCINSPPSHSDWSEYSLRF